MNTNLFFEDPEPRTRIRVSFRKDKGGEVSALFFDTWPIQGYTHVGQHFECVWEWVKETKPAKPSEYNPLLSELAAVGYDVTIMKKMVRPNPNKVLCPKCGELITPNAAEYERWCFDEDRNLRQSFDVTKVKRIGIKEWALKNHVCKKTKK